VPVLSFAEISNAAQVKVLGRFELEDDLEEAFEDEHDQGLEALDNEDAA
jgi:type III secretion protein V